MNFSGVYDQERFARDTHFVHLDCTGLRGTECYCDAEGMARLRSLIAPYSAEGVHFIDSGDFHYMTKLWTDKLSRPFSLMLFDHHTDMQPPRWEGLLSCGGWVKAMLDSNPLLHHVYLMGIPADRKEAVPAEYRRRVDIVSDERLRVPSPLRLPIDRSEPLYLSIDKDVLAPSAARTNWDQGILSLPDLHRAVAQVMTEEKVIGVDICGEYSLQPGCGEEARVDDRANRALLDWLE